MPPSGWYPECRILRKQLIVVKNVKKWLTNNQRKCSGASSRLASSKVSPAKAPYGRYIFAYDTLPSTERPWLPLVLLRYKVLFCAFLRI
jgi:hypothetical protein